MDYDHPAFGGFGAGHKIRFGHNFIDPANDDEHAGSHRLENDPYDLCPGDDGGKLLRPSLLSTILMLSSCQVMERMLLE